MAKKLTVKQMDARPEGLLMADWLKKEALKWLHKANLARVAPGL
jgi:hypothetical protein